MKKNSSLIIALFIFCILFLSTNLVYAVPMPITIAINNQTKQISSYWPGDEFYYNALPSGWEGYGYSCEDDNASNCTFVTDLGTFNFTKDGAFFSENWYSEFCNKTGYTYIEAVPDLEHGMTDWYKQWLEEQNIENEGSTDYTWLFVISIVCIVFLIVFLVFRFKKTKGSN